MLPALLLSSCLLGILVTLGAPRNLMTLTQGVTSALRRATLLPQVIKARQGLLGPQVAGEHLLTGLGIILGLSQP